LSSVTTHISFSTGRARQPSGVSVNLGRLNMRSSLAGGSGAVVLVAAQAEINPATTTPRAKLETNLCGDLIRRFPPVADSRIRAVARWRLRRQISGARFLPWSQHRPCSANV
jgi:hypothetical protein